VTSDLMITMTGASYRLPGHQMVYAHHVAARPRCAGTIMTDVITHVVVDCDQGTPRHGCPSGTWSVTSFVSWPQPLPSRQRPKMWCCGTLPSHQPPNPQGQTVVCNRLHPADSCPWHVVHTHKCLFTGVNTGSNCRHTLGMCALGAPCCWSVPDLHTQPRPTTCPHSIH
jgi:hypothetical protein